ncbi:hypothetical protein DPMN_107360 [Dreissena polymorpha]|uniref:Uncharacterized protein n=1 Tax=Dreissena polymorpha TaxID=45954 RepID=A0A9D4K710_DREPO|nr:hypothetical protein DPMN_107360 [Dreissena polymorpha]
MVTTTVPEAVPVVTEQSTVISTASAVGVAIGVIILFLILVCACLIYLYYRKRKEKEAEADRLPLSKAHPANIRLKNSDLYRESLRKREKPTLMTETKSNGAVNGDVKLDIDKDPGIQRENSIYFTMNSRGGSGMGPLETPNIRPGSVAPVEEPDKVNNPADQTIAESEFETTAADAVLASTFLPISPDDHAELNYTDAEIREIERKAEKEKEKDNEKDEFDMDEIDDELGLPRLSRAFTPVAQPQPEPATLPSIAYKKQVDDTGSLDDTREDGIKKVKVKKHLRKKKRALSSRESLQDRLASAMGRAESFNKETPFLERIKKMDKEKAELEQKAQLEKEMKQIENEVIKARVSLGASRSATNKSNR